jgi:hypothetical protein
MKKSCYTLLILISLIGCKKEKFPKSEDLIGNWIEITDNSFKHELIFETEKVYFVKPSQTDTLTYVLDKKEELMFVSSSFGEGSLKIILNKKEGLLTVWGLFPSIPEKVSETVFKQE